MRILRNLFLLFLATLLITTIPTVLLTRTVEQTLLEPDFYMNIYDKYEVYDLAQDQIMANFPIEGLQGAQLEEIVPESWVRENLQFVLVQHLDYVKGETEVLVCTIELDVLRDNARALLTTLMSQELIAQLPVGADLAMSQVIIAQVEAQVDGLIDVSLPESINVAYYTYEYANQAREGVQMFLLAARYLLYTAIVLFLLIAIFARPNASFLRWDGASLILGAGMTYGMVTTALAMAPELIAEQVGTLPIPEEVVTGLLGDIFAPLVASSRQLLSWGVLMFVLSFVLHLIPFEKVTEKLPFELPFGKGEKKPAKPAAKPKKEKPAEISKKPKA